MRPTIDFVRFQRFFGSQNSAVASAVRDAMSVPSFADSRSPMPRPLSMRSCSNSSTTSAGSELKPVREASTRYRRRNCETACPASVVARPFAVSLTSGIRPMVALRSFDAAPVASSPPTFSTPTSAAAPSVAFVAAPRSFVSRRSATTILPSLSKAYLSDLSSPYREAAEIAPARRPVRSTANGRVYAPCTTSSPSMSTSSVGFRPLNSRRAFSFSTSPISTMPPARSWRYFARAARRSASS